MPRSWADWSVRYEFISIPSRSTTRAGSERCGACARRVNVEMFAGRVYDGPREIVVRTMGELDSLEAIRSLVVKDHGHAKVYVRDLAQVRDGHQEVRLVTRLDGHSCVKLSVQKQPDANTVAVAEALVERMGVLGPSMPEHIQVGMVENQADYVGGALSSVKTAALQAAILVLVVSLLFLGSARQALILLIALPATLASTCR